MSAQWVGDYEIDRSRVLGLGGQARVFLGFHTTTRQEVAVREVELADAHTLNFCRREVENVEGLASPFIVKYLHHEINEHDQRAYFVQEYVPGGSLADFIRRWGRVDEHTAKRWMKEIVAGMEEVWSHDIIHRDLKPANIFLTAQDRSADIRIGDFGISKTAKYSGAVETAGTELYMAPEMRDHGICSFSADIWSLGVVYFEMLFGTQKQLNLQSVSQALERSSKFARTYILAMLQPDPEVRISRKELVNRFRLLKQSRIHTEATCKTNAMTDLITSASVTVKKFRDPLRAAEIASLLTSLPGLVSCRSNWASGGYSFLELEEHPTLEWLVQEHGPVCEFIAARWIKQLLETTQHLRKKGLVHTDLSPKSVYLEKDDFSARVLIGDLENCVYRAPRLSGSDCTALELSQNPASPAVDSWGLGCVLRYMLQGQVTDRTLAPGTWQTLISGLLAPSDRLTVGQAAILAEKARKEAALGPVPEMMSQFPREYDTATKSCEVIKRLCEKNRIDAAHLIAQLLLSVVANVEESFGGCERFLKELGSFVERQQALAEYQLSSAQPLPELRETLCELIEQVDLDEESQQAVRRNLEGLLGSWVQGNWNDCTELGLRSVCKLYEVDSEFVPIRVTKCGVVIKQILLDGEQAAVQFRSEMKQLVELSSPYLVKYHDFDVIKESGYIVMSYVEGPSVQALGRVRAGTALRWVSQLVQALKLLDKHSCPVRRLSCSDVLLTKSDPENADVQLLYKLSGPVATESIVHQLGNLLKETCESSNTCVLSLLSEMASGKLTLSQLASKLAQRFQLQRELRQESNGEVLQALDPMAADTVEVKFVKQEVEADVMKCVRGPFVRNLLEVQQVSEGLYLYMEHCGGSLADFLRTSGVLCAEAARKWMKQLLMAVADIHAQDCAHLNISLSSVLLTSVDLDGTAKLADFGQSRRNAQQEDKQSDIVSLGKVFYHMLEGHKGENFAWQFASGHSSDLVERMLRGECKAAESLQHPFFSEPPLAFDQSQVHPGDSPVVRQACGFLGELLQASKSLLARNCADVAVRLLMSTYEFMKRLPEHASPELQNSLAELSQAVAREYWAYFSLASVQTQSADLRSVDLKSLQVRDCGHLRKLVAQAAEVEAASYSPLPREDETDSVAAKLGFRRRTLLAHSATSTTLLVEDLLAASLWVKKYVVDGFEASCHPSFVDMERISSRAGFTAWHLPYYAEGSVASWIASRGVLSEAEFRGPAARLLRVLWQVHEDGLQHGHLQPDKVVLDGAGFRLLQATEKRREDLQGVGGVLYYMLSGQQLREEEYGTEIVTRRLQELSVSTGLKEWLFGMLAPGSQKTLRSLIDDPYFQHLRFVPISLQLPELLITKGTDLFTSSAACLKEVRLGDEDSIKAYTSRTALTKVESPYLLKYLYVSSPRAHATVLMESAEEDLEQYLRRTTVSEETASRWMVQLQQAAAALWKQHLTHGAISAAHVMVCGGELRLSSLHVCVDQKYSAPEAAGSVAADIWALGVVFFELAVGICHEVDVNCLDAVSQVWKNIIVSMLATDAEKRISPDKLEIAVKAFRTLHSLHD